jgi:hypothetical protein
MSVPLTLFLTCLVFFGLMSLDFPCAAHDFFPYRFSNPCQGLHHTSSEIGIMFDNIPLSLSTKSRQSYTTPYKMSYISSISTNMRESLYTDSKGVLVLPPSCIGLLQLS